MLRLPIYYHPLSEGLCIAERLSNLGEKRPRLPRPRVRLCPPSRRSAYEVQRSTPGSLSYDLGHGTHSPFFLFCRSALVARLPFQRFNHAPETRRRLFPLDSLYKKSDPKHCNILLRLEGTKGVSFACFFQLENIPEATRDHGEK